MKGLRITIGFLIASVIFFVAISIAGAQENECAGYWTFSYSFEFDPGYWTVGDHNYDISVISGPFTGATWSNEFEVAEPATLIDGQVQLRVFGLISMDGPQTVINPAQDTIMQVTWAFFESRNEANDLRSATTVVFRWDDGDWVNVLPSPVTSLCAWDNPGRFLRSWGTHIGDEIEIGSISGLVETEAGEPISDTYVAVCEESVPEDELWTCPNVGTDQDGFYRMGSLPSGNYRVVGGDDWYLREFYNDTPSYTEAQLVPVTAGANTPDINFSLLEAGIISGRVETELGEPISDTDVTVCEESVPEDENWACPNVGTDQDGFYRMGSLPSGNYRVGVFGDERYLLEYFDDAPSYAEAELVPVTAGEITSGIDFILEFGGSISGNVSDADGPLAFVWVEACNWEDTFCHGAETNENGDYIIYGLPGGDYRVSVWGGQGGWLDQFYNNKRFYEDPDPVPVTVGADTGDIDFVMDPAGSISGNVSDANGPVVSVWVDACNWDDTFCHSDETNENGDYTLYSLPGGDYRVSVGGGQGAWFDEFYNNKRLHENADPVFVTVGNDTGDIDFVMDPAGSISGNVSDANGPVASVWVDACNWDDTFCHSDETNENGDYTLYSLPGGDYRVSVWGGQGGWLDEFYNDQLYWHEADRVTVNPGENTPGIDFSMEVGGTISGTVTDELGNPITDRIDVSACLFTDDSICWWTSVQPDGSYAIYGLSTEDYRVHTYPVNGGYWFDEWYDDTRDWSMADPVSVTAGFETPDINFLLQLSGSISGWVTDESGDPIINIWVDACEESVLEDEWGSHPLCNGAETDENGFYTITSMQPGNHRVVIWGDELYPSQFFDHVSSYYEAQLVPVIAGEITSDINFSLIEASP
jgi:hypothetical protein